MNRNPWTFGQKIAGGFTLVVLLTVVLGWISIRSLRTLLADKDHVLAVNAESMIEANHMESALNGYSSAVRGFLLTAEPKFQENMADYKAEYEQAVSRLSELNPDRREDLDAVERQYREWLKVSEDVVEQRRQRRVSDPIAQAFDQKVYPIREDMRRRIDGFSDEQRKALNAAAALSSRRADSAVSSMNVLIGLAILASLLLALILTQLLSRQIGAAIQHVQSSSSELQAAANQQASGAREQASSMGEISTTISELLATSRQIAESAQRVAGIAGQSAKAAQTGGQTVEGAQESVAAIRRQVDLIVSHMLELGRKSQQIGGVLEIINELAEQTNILSINASVEAAGAGEAGRRFAVVADEIRKLADRVGGSTKEIRGLIEEVRAAVNTTVMATEGGAKAAEAGSRQFGEVSAAFKNISGLVGTSTEAAREIELSTKQQATAVEQVNVAISNVAQATRETESSATQTLQTAVELTTLAKDLARLVQTQGQGARA